jgi:hypothetical protein
MHLRYAQPQIPVYLSRAAKDNCLLLDNRLIDYNPARIWLGSTIWLLVWMMLLLFINRPQY